MIMLTQLKALAKEHNLPYSYMNKDEIIAELINKRIITTADLCQPKLETKETKTVQSNSSKYERLKNIRNNPRTVEVTDRDTGEVMIYPSTYKAWRAIKPMNRRGRYEFKVI